MMMWIFLILGFLSQAQQQNKLLEITVGTPYNISRNKALLEYYDLLSESFKDAGFKLVIKQVSLKSTYQMLLDNDVDSIFYDDLSDHRRRNQVVTTSFPIRRTKAYAFYLKDSAVDDKKLEKFRGVIPSYYTVLMSEAKKRKLKFSGVTSSFHCIQAVFSKLADYCLMGQEVGQSAMLANPQAAENITMGTTVFLEIPIYISLNKKFKKDLPRIEEALRAQIKKNIWKYPSISETLNKDP